MPLRLCRSVRLPDVDVTKIIQDFYAELDALDEAIAAMERLLVARGGAKKRGRPPKWLKQAREKAKDES